MFAFEVLVSLLTVGYVLVLGLRGEGKVANRRKGSKGRKSIKGSKARECSTGRKVGRVARVARVEWVAGIIGGFFLVTAFY